MSSHLVGTRTTLTTTTWGAMNSRTSYVWRELALVSLPLQPLSLPPSPLRQPGLHVRARKAAILFKEIETSFEAST